MITHREFFNKDSIAKAHLERRGCNVPHRVRGLSTVEIHGLKSRQDLDGEHGNVLTFDCERERYIVVLESQDGQPPVMVRPRNLRKYTAPKKPKDLSNDKEGGKPPKVPRVKGTKRVACPPTEDKPEGCFEKSLCPECFQASQDGDLIDVLKSPANAKARVSEYPAQGWATKRFMCSTCTLKRLCGDCTHAWLDDGLLLRPEDSKAMTGGRSPMAGPPLSLFDVFFESKGR